MQDYDKPENSAGAQLLQIVARLSWLIGSTLQLNDTESASITIVRDNIGQC